MERSRVRVPVRTGALEVAGSIVAVVLVLGASIAEFGSLGNLALTMSAASGFMQFWLELRRALQRRQISQLHLDEQRGIGQSVSMNGGSREYLNNSRS